MTTLFGGGKKPSAPTVAQPTVQDTGQSNAAAQVGRASLYLTSPQGVLDPTKTASGRLLGN